MNRAPAASEPAAGVSLLARLSGLGASAQASIPGVYAWCVTVAPVAWSHGAPFVAKLFALAGLGALAAGVALESRRPAEVLRARATCIWGLTLSSALTWLCAPGALSTLRIDLGSGLGGMLGWALFAIAAAAPMVKRDVAGEARIVEGPPLRPRTRLARGDVTILSVGTTLAFVLQAVGWRAAPVERGVLTRLTVLACGIALIGGSVEIALARHARRLPAPRKERIRRSLPWMALTLLLVVTGLAWGLLAHR